MQLRRPSSEPIHLIGGRCLTGDGVHSATITITGRQITAIGPPRSRSRTGEAFVDATDLLVAPGFVDLQVNGGFGYDLASSPADVWDLGRRLPATGVTSFLPTLISGPPELPERLLQVLQERPDRYRGAEPLGAHFEGPMIEPARAGAHLRAHIVTPSFDAIAGWSLAAGVQLVTIAPELPGAMEVIAELTARGVTVFGGHTSATVDHGRDAIEAGMRGVTHLFNAMAPLGHRAPNLAGLALADDRLVAGLIADGVHVDPVVVAAVWKAKGADGVALVTDAVAAAGVGPGSYRLGGHRVTADESSARMADGTLAGSLLTMNQAVANVVEMTGCNVEDAVRAASTTPASLLGQDDRGRLVRGGRADIVLLTDGDVLPQVTIGGGAILHIVDPGRLHLPRQATDRWADL